MHRNIAALPLLVAAFGCSSSPQPYAHSADSFPAGNPAAQSKPVVEVRVATGDEAASIEDFPGRKDFESSARNDSIAGGAIFLIGLPVFLPLIAVASLESLSNGSPEARDPTPAELSELLKGSLEKRLRYDVPPDSHQVLEVVYSFGRKTIGPAADTACFVLHSRVTLRNDAEVLYQTIVHVDPRVIEDGYRPTCAESGDAARTYFEKELPSLIERRIPGLPWAQDGS